MTSPDAKACEKYLSFVLEVEEMHRKYLLFMGVYRLKRCVLD